MGKYETVRVHKCMKRQNSKNSKIICCDRMRTDILQNLTITLKSVCYNITFGIYFIFENIFKSQNQQYRYVLKQFLTKNVLINGTFKKMRFCHSK